MGFFDRFRRKPAPQKGHVSPTFTAARAFAGAKTSHLTGGWVPVSSSADMESFASLTRLRDRSRSLVRDNAHAKRAKALIQNNVVGCGIGMQSQIVNNRGRLLDEINSPIEQSWREWCKPDNCHIGGTLHFAEIERLVVGECFEAGDVLIRLHYTGRGAVPLSLEVIEPERLAAEWEIKPAGGNLVRQGVEVDQFYRPVAYWIRTWHPGEVMLPMGARDELLRVPADQIIHLKITERWPQVRGIPWMHAAIARLHQLGEFQDAAVIAARVGAEKVMVLKETEDGRLADSLGTPNNDGTLSWGSAKGQVDILPSGTDIADWQPNYPDTNYGPFVTAALRDVAAAFGVSYESLSRDYSTSNYSSSRLALLDDRDGWKVLQQWYIRSVRERLYPIWLQAALMARAIPGVSIEDYMLNRTKFEAVKWKPRGWSWVDPTKEVTAYKEAEKAGYITKADIIAATSSNDIEDVLRERRRELDMLDEMDLHTDTTEGLEPPEPAPAPAAPEPDDTDDEQPARILSFKRDYE